MVGENQGFLHYLFYYDVISDDKKIENLVGEYEANFNKLIVELKSYLPIIFYENGRTGIANQMIVNLCSIENARRDYPENSYTVIEHLTRGLMGINVNAASNSFSTLPRLGNADDWAEMKNIPLLSNKVTVKHYGQSKTEVRNVSGGTLNWTSKIPGIHEFLYVNGEKTKCNTVSNGRQLYSYVALALNNGDSAVVSTKP